MDALCDVFVKELHSLISRSLGNDVPENEQKLNEYFSKSVDFLPSDLIKSYLKDNYNCYFKAFCRLFGNPDNVCSSRNQIDLAYALKTDFVDHRKAIKELKTLPISNRVSVLAGMVYHTTAENVNDIFTQAADALGGRNSDHFFQLCIKLLMLKPHKLPILAVAMQVASYLSLKCDEMIRETCSDKAFEEFLNKIKLCCSLLGKEELNMEMTAKFGEYTYADIIAAILSVYFDVFVRYKSISSKENDDKEQIVKDLLNYINFIIKDDQTVILDVLLQVDTNLKGEAEQNVYNIYHHAMQNLPSMKTHLQFVKFLMVSKQAIQLAKKCENGKTKYFLSNIKKQEAPTGLIEWLHKHEFDIPIEITSVKQFIKHVLNDEIEFTLPKMKTVDQSETETTTQETEAEQESENFENLFFFDTKPSGQKFQPAIIDCGSDAKVPVEELEVSDLENEVSDLENDDIKLTILSDSETEEKYNIPCSLNGGSDGSKLGELVLDELSDILKLAEEAVEPEKNYYDDIRNNESGILITEIEDMDDFKSEEFPDVDHDGIIVEDDISDIKENENEEIPKIDQIVKNFEDEDMKPASPESAKEKSNKVISSPRSLRNKKLPTVESWILSQTAAEIQTSASDGSEAKVSTSPKKQKILSPKKKKNEADEAVKNKDDTETESTSDVDKSSSKMESSGITPEKIKKLTPKKVKIMLKKEKKLPENTIIIQKDESDKISPNKLQTSNGKKFNSVEDTEAEKSKSSPIKQSIKKVKSDDVKSVDESNGIFDSEMLTSDSIVSDIVVESKTMAKKRSPVKKKLSTPAKRRIIDSDTSTDSSLKKHTPKKTMTPKKNTRSPLKNAMEDTTESPKKTQLDSYTITSRNGPKNQHDDNTNLITETLPPDAKENSVISKTIAKKRSPEKRKLSTPAKRRIIDSDTDSSIKNSLPKKITSPEKNNPNFPKADSPMKIDSVDRKTRASSNSPIKKLRRSRRRLDSATSDSASEIETRPPIPSKVQRPKTILEESKSDTNNSSSSSVPASKKQKATPARRRKPPVLGKIKITPRAITGRRTSSDTASDSSVISPGTQRKRKAVLSEDNDSLNEMSNLDSKIKLEEQSQHTDMETSTKCPLVSEEDKVSDNCSNKVLESKNPEEDKTNLIKVKISPQKNVGSSSNSGEMKLRTPRKRKTVLLNDIASEDVEMESDKVIDTDKIIGTIQSPGYKPTKESVNVAKILLNSPKRRTVSEMIPDTPRRSRRLRLLKET